MYHLLSPSFVSHPQIGSVATDPARLRVDRHHHVDGIEEKHSTMLKALCGPQKAPLLDVYFNDIRIKGLLTK
jgi:hypothetical protein